MPITAWHLREVAHWHVMDWTSDPPGVSRLALHAGGGGRQTESEAPAQQAAPGRGGGGVRNAQQGTARIKGGAKQRGGGTTKVGVRKERLGTQRVGGKRPGRIGGGTTRMGGGTAVIGGNRGKGAGPRGLFGGRSGRRDTQLVRCQAADRTISAAQHRKTSSSWVQPYYRAAEQA